MFDSKHFLRTPVLYNIQVHTLKKNIGLFSGFVWAKNEVTFLNPFFFFMSLVSQHSWVCLRLIATKAKDKSQEEIWKLCQREVAHFLWYPQYPCHQSAYKEGNILQYLLMEFLEFPCLIADSII